MKLMWRAVAAAFLLFVFLPSSYAQRGGGHAGGMHGGGGGMHGFAGGGMHSFGGAGMHSFGGARPAASYRAAPMGVARFSSGSFAGRQLSYRPYFSPSTRSNFGRSQVMMARSFPQRRGEFGHESSFRSSRSEREFRSRGDRDFHHHRFHDRFFYAFPYYYYGTYWDGLYGDEYWNPYYSFGPYSYDPNVGSSTYTDLSNQLGNMNLQLQQLRDENESLLSELDQSRAPAAPTSAQSSSTGVAPTTVLVFNDGHQKEIQNYAIVGQTLWILSDARATKIPLADLNLKQTIKTNEDRGVEFLGPASKQ